MTSYRTLVFGSIAMICATAPALADSAHAIPGPVTTAASSVSIGTMDSAHAIPAPVTTTAATHQSASAPQPAHGITLNGLLNGLHIPGAQLILQFIQH